MNIRALLTDVESMLAEELVMLPLTVASTTGAYLERYYTLDKLKQIFNTTNLDVPASADTLQPFIDFLNERWELVGHYPEHIFYSTRICLLLAAALANYVDHDTNKFQLVIPTIKPLNNDLTATDYSADFLPFVLSDTNEIIEVLYCLDMAREDGVLKHTQLFEELVPEATTTKKIVKNLNAAEAHRVIHYCPETQSYFESITALQARKKTGLSIGAFIERLIDKLHEGSAYTDNLVPEQERRRHGIAGHDASEGIGEFITFLDTLEGCYIEFCAALPEPRFQQKNHYYLLRQQNSWSLIYIDNNKIKRTISIGQVKISEYTQDLKLADILKSVGNISIEQLTIGSKKTIRGIIEAYHYNSAHRNDGTEKGDLYNRVGPSWVLNRNFKFYFDRLANPQVSQDENGLSVIFCVGMIQGALRGILQHNKDLYDTYPKNSAAALEASIKLVEADLSKAHDKAHAAVNSRHFAPDIKLSKEQSDTIKRKIMLECGKKNSPQFNEFLSGKIASELLVDKNLATAILTEKQLLYVFNGLRATEKPKFLALMTEVNPKLIKTLLRNNTIWGLNLDNTFKDFIQQAAIITLLAEDAELIAELLAKDAYRKHLLGWLVSAATLPLFSRLLAAHPKFALGFSAAALVSAGADAENSDFSALDCLMKNTGIGYQVLNQLLTQNTTLFAEIPIEALFKWCFYREARELLASIMATRTDEQLHLITAEMLFRPIEFAAFRHEIPLNHIQSSPEGQRIIERITTVNPNLFTVEALFTPSQTGAYVGTTLFYWLACTKSGRNVFNSLCDSNPEIIHQLSRDILCLQKTSGADAGASAFYALAKTTSGQKMLLHLFAQKPELLIITAEALFHRVKGGEYPGTSAFYWLISSGEGRLLVNKLFDANPEFIMHVSENFLKSPIDEESFAGSSPLKILEATTSGQHILLRLTQNPQLTSLIMQKLNGVRYASLNPLSVMRATSQHPLHNPVVQDFIAVLYQCYLDHCRLPTPQFKQNILSAVKAFLQTMPPNMQALNDIEKFVKNYSHTSAALIFIKFRQHSSYDSIRTLFTRKVRETTSFDQLLTQVANKREELALLSHQIYRRGV